MSVDDIYKLAIVVQREILPSIEDLISGIITTSDYNSVNSIENLIKAFNQTSLPEGSIRDPLKTESPSPGPSPGTTNENNSSSSSLSLVRSRF